MLARALALEPDVLLLDEPTSALDEEARDAVEETLRRLQEELAFVRAGHARPRPGRPHSDWVVRLEKGGTRRVTAPIDVTPRRGRRDAGAGRAGHGRLALGARGPRARHRHRGARSFLQLTAVGFVINAIFEQDSLVFVFALIAVMVVFGALTARGRARVPGSFMPLLVALAAAAATLALVVALGLFEPKPRFLVPVGGMVVGNAMTAAAVSLNRLGDEVRRAPRIEATLALGATARRRCSRSCAAACARG